MARSGYLRKDGRIGPSSLGPAFGQLFEREATRGILLFRRNIIRMFEWLFLVLFSLIIYFVIRLITT